MKINLFSAWFKSADQKRAKELDLCLDKNIRNQHIDRFFVYENWPTYEDFFKQTRDFPNDINIISNGDIYFDDSVKHVRNMKDKEAYALTRWELVKGQVISFTERHMVNQSKPKHSQDVWVFKGKVDRVFGGFHLGVPGCDNRIAAEIINAGYQLKNPSLTIRAIHVHSSDKRNYQGMEQIPGPYKWVEQTAL